MRSGDLFGPYLISNAESCASIIAACIPTYRPLFNYLVHGDAKRGLTSTNSYGTGTSKRTKATESSGALVLNDTDIELRENDSRNSRGLSDIHVSGSFAVECGNRSGV